jgi:hypothetical protein
MIESSFGWFSFNDSGNAISYFDWACLAKASNNNTNFACLNINYPILYS